MGIAITPETLSQLKTKNIPKENIKNNINNSNTNSKKNKNNNYWDILYNIYSPFFSKLKKEEPNKTKNEIILNINSENENIIIENKDNTNSYNISNINNEIHKNKNEEEKEDEELNNIIFGKHKSFDLSNNIDSLFENNENNKINIYTSQNNEYNKKELNSEKDNESNNSDYADISKEFLLFNKKKNKKKNKKSDINNDKNILKSKKIRDAYYNKLVITNQWNTLKKEKVFNNIFFFDWDDTLLCTSYLLPTGALNDMEINKKDKAIISNLDSIVSKLLAKTVKLGLVFIITNGAPGWVEMSSKKFYPQSAKIITKIKIISARGLCEKKLPGDMRQWKTRAFKYALNSIEIKKNIPTNIIVLGDSIIEMEASYNIKDFFSNAYLKTIKFKESPSHIELEKELKIIFAQLDSILTNFKNLSIKVTRKKNE